jgi:hypothetical protein
VYVAAIDLHFADAIAAPFAVRKYLRSTSRGLLQGPAEWSNNASNGLISQPNM